MKKILCFILMLFFIIQLCGCNSSDTESVCFTQEVTIVKMPSPPKCKTTNSNTIVNEVIEVLGLIDKSPIQNDENINGWAIMIKIRIDGQELTYTIGDVFTDSDGKQYKVTNYDFIANKINEIYDKIDSAEVQYS